MVSKSCALAGFLAPESLAKYSLTLFLLQSILGEQGEALEPVRGDATDCFTASSPTE